MPFTMTMPGLMTADDLERLGGDFKHAELWDGRLCVGEPAAFYGGVVGVRIASAISAHVLGRRLGWVADACTGFLLRRDPDRVLAPDVSFVRRERMPVLPRRGFAPLAPDLVAEVRSPRDSWTKVLQRGGVWTGHDVGVVWLIDPLARRAVTMRPQSEPEEIESTGVLSGEPVLPGLAIPLLHLFEGIEREDPGDVGS